MKKVSMSIILATTVMLASEVSVPATTHHTGMASSTSHHELYPGALGLTQGIRIGTAEWGSQDYYLHGIDRNKVDINHPEAGCNPIDC